MVSLEKFETLIEGNESTTLDFKSSMYDFKNDADLGATAKLVKDVISFCNTIRNETSYIIIGVEEKQTGKILHGLDADVDDSILQQKVMSKVQPRPLFHYYTLISQEKKFGVLEFPVIKYSTPIMPVVKKKGIDIGKVYYRQGTSNTEALALQVIHISDWLKSLPEYNTTVSVSNEINNLIKDLTTKEKKLSSVIADIYAVAQKFKLNDIINFCAIELQGISSNVEVDDIKFGYRIQKITISANSIEFNPHYFNLTKDVIKKFFKDNEGFHEYRMMFSQSIVGIEEILENFEQKKNSVLGTIAMDSKSVFKDDKPSYKIHGFFFVDTITSLYSNIRQKTIDLLMLANK